MEEMDILIKKAKERDQEAMLELIGKFNPLLKKQAGSFTQMGLEYDDAYQQGVLCFISGIYKYEPMPPVTFAGYMKKRIKWGLWMYWRSQFKTAR